MAESVVVNLQAVGNPKVAAVQAASSTVAHYFAEADFVVAGQTAAPRLPAHLLAAESCGIREA